MKRLLSILLVLLVILSISACVHTGEDKNPDASKYPEGAILLTKDNFTEFFDIRIDTECSYNYDLGQTDVVSYVAFVPRGTYSQAVGEVTFEVNTVLKQAIHSSGYFKAVIGEKSLRLHEGIINASYTGGRSAGRDESYFVDDSTEALTISAVEGYLIRGEAPKNRYELITDSEANGSGEVFTEIRSRVDEFATLFELSDSYNYSAGVAYELGSLYGEGKSVSGKLTDHYTVDLKNNRYEDSRAKYYLHDGIPTEQKLNAYGMVIVEGSSFTAETILERATPNWDFYDPTAIYVKERDGLYYGYTNLSLMKDGEWKDAIKNRLEEYGVTSSHDKFVVEYEFGFDEASFRFSATAIHYDPQYPVHYVDINVAAIQKISDVGNTSVQLYSPDNCKFLLPEDEEDAITYKPGMIDVSTGTKSFAVTVYSDSYEGYNNTVVDNWLAINITEAGRYSFTPSEKSIQVFDLNFTKQYNNGDYFEAGIYLIKFTSIVYGLSVRTVTVESSRFVDYGDLTAPDAIDANGNIKFTLEGQGDRVVYSYTPSASGIYDFGYSDNIFLYAYVKGELDDCADEAWGQGLCLQLEGGVEYVLVFECVNYNTNSEPLDFDAVIEHLGQPGGESVSVDCEWKDVFLWGEDDPVLTVEISSPGIYYVDLELAKGQAITYGSFYTEDGKPVEPGGYKMTVDGREVWATALPAGRYIYDPSLYTNRYFIGRARLVLHTAGVGEEHTVQLTKDSYTKITTADLNTVHSYSSFTFEVTESCRLIATEASDSFTLLDQNGNQIAFTVYPLFVDNEHGGIECVRSARVLSPGKYTILFKISEYNDPGVKTADVRLLLEQ